MAVSLTLALQSHFPRNRCIAQRALLLCLPSPLSFIAPSMTNAVSVITGIGMGASDV